MATPMTPDQIVAAYRRWGVPFREKTGWRDHGRPGAWGPVNGIMIHHTGDDAPDDADERVLWGGRSDLPGPLCHDGQRDDGLVVLMSAKRANHAGAGSGRVLAAMQRDQVPPGPGPDDTDGNAHFYGREVMYSGSKAPTALAYRSTVLACAARCEFHGWDPHTSIIGHNGWTLRKIDPRNLSITKLRDDVATELRLGPPSLRAVAKPPTTATATTAGTGGEESDMKLVSYAGKVYIVSGLMRRYVPGAPGLLAALVKAYGPVRAITRDEMGLYTPLDTVLAIQGGTAKSVGLTLSGQAAIAADLDALQDDLADDGAPGASA